MTNVQLVEISDAALEIVAGGQSAGSNVSANAGLDLGLAAAVGDLLSVKVDAKAAINLNLGLGLNLLGLIAL